MRVYNMTSRKGSKIVNQFIIESDHAMIFQSYNSIIAKIENGRVYLDSECYNYSKTTVKYRNFFLNCTSKEVEQNIKNGIYIMTNLNSGGNI